jgi:hypothetical protein
MGNSTRRGFLAMAGVGAAAVGAGGSSRAAAAEQRSTGPLVAYVRDVRRGEIAVMVGEHEVVVRDRDLVNRLVHASRS